MKVLHVYQTYFPDPPGGLQEAIRQICLSTQCLGVKNTIFTLSAHPYPTIVERPEAQVVRSYSWMAPASCNLGSPTSLWQFIKLTKKVDVIHLHFPWPFADLLYLFSFSRKPIIMTYHSDVVRQRLLGKFYHPLMKYTLRHMNAVVATSPPYLKTSAVLNNYVVKDRLRMIPLGIEEDSYVKVENNTILNRFGFMHDFPFILFIGVLRYYKGLHTLLEASMSTQGVIVIAGSGRDYDILRKKVIDLGIKNIIFTGQVTEQEKITLLLNCRALVLPSHLRSEAYGMVLVEACMFEKAMVSCEIGTGTSYVNKHEETGYVIPPNNPLALAKALNLLLADENLAKRFGAAARKRYETLFSGKALGHAYKTLYDEVSCNK